MAEELKRVDPVDGVGSVQRSDADRVKPMLGVPFLRMPKTECALLGNALVAATATGFVDDIASTASSWHTLPAAVEPDPAWHAPYRQLRAIFTELTAQVDPVFRRLQEFAALEDVRAAPH